MSSNATNVKTPNETKIPKISKIQKETKVPIALAERSYDILLGSGLLSNAELYAQLPNAKTALIVTNTTVAPLYADSLRQTLSQHYPQVLQLILPDGEAYKDWTRLQLIFDTLLENACDRQTVLFALGGGVIGDITGFAASCYMRGVPFVQIPTTLLAQVDSSVGGKTAINHPIGKNMIGAFYQPRLVIADIETLQTLPEREFAAGLAEVIKYGIMADASFFSWLENHLDSLCAREPSALVMAIQRSCEIKAQIVSLDEREGASQLRATLNFGHTFGHAIEAGLGYGAWLHGEAVACGMVMATRLSQQLGLIEDALVQRITQLIARAKLPTVGPATLSAADYLHHMRVDKKSLGGSLQFIVIEQLGHSRVLAAPDELVVAALHH